MKSFGYKFLVKLFYKLGFYADIRRFPKLEKFYKQLSAKPREVQIHELKKICSTLRTAGDQKYYNALLEMYIPEWDKPIKRSRFVGQNLWSGFNSYRRVRIDKQRLFEKLYVTHCLSLEKSLWFQDHIHPLIGDSIKAPEIHRIYRGELLSLVYSDFIKGKPTSEKEAETLAIAFGRYLYEVSLKPGFYKVFNEAPDYLYDFKRHHRYRMFFKDALPYFQEMEIPYGKIENRLENGRIIFTHGDIKGLNMFPNDYLIDWDEWGFYPAGMEQAFIYYRNLLFFDKADTEPLDWLKTNFKDLPSANEWELFELSFCYFLFIFSIEKIEKDELNELKNNLLKEIELRS